MLRHMGMPPVESEGVRSLFDLCVERKGPLPKRRARPRVVEQAGVSPALLDASVPGPVLGDSRVSQKYLRKGVLNESTSPTRCGNSSCPRLLGPCPGSNEPHSRTRRQGARLHSSQQRLEGSQTQRFSR